MRSKERTVKFKYGLAAEAGIICLLLLCVPIFLRNDCGVFIRWYVCLQILGIGVYPLTSVLFSSFTDRGFVFSKVLGLTITGFAEWALSVTCGVPFTPETLWILTLLAFAVIWGIFLFGRYFRSYRNERNASDSDNSRVHLNRKVYFRKSLIEVHMKNGSEGYPDAGLILTEEIIFLAAFLVWAYLCGFHAEAYGTEKFMDYGFVAAMVRSTKLPAVDIWHASDPINYYYGGQYFTAFLTKMTGSRVSDTYNLMRAMVAAFSFVFPFSICFQMHVHSETRRIPADSGVKSGSVQFRKHQKVWVCLGGVISGCAVSLAGNLHYVLYGLLGGVLNLNDGEAYYFPDSTRFIGYNPPTDDKCIHEFPAYSFVLGDLHAHMVNLIFVLLFLGILTAWIFSTPGLRHLAWRKAADGERSTENGNTVKEKHLGEKNIPTDRKAGCSFEAGRNIEKKQFLRSVFSPHLIALSFLVGMFQWTNYWDFVIYLTVLIFALLFLMIRDYRQHMWQGILVTVCRFILALAVLSLSSAPFRIGFDMIASGVRVAGNHTPLWQWLILWGLPAATVILFAVFIIRRGRYEGKWENTDLWAVLLSVCAVGLILIPELVYVKDIYEDGYSRANTMFKLTYQAFLIFGILSGYDLIRMIRYRNPDGSAAVSGKKENQQSSNHHESDPSKIRLQGKQNQFESGTQEVRQQDISYTDDICSNNRSVAGRRAFDVWIKVLSYICLTLFVLTFGYIGNAVKSWMGPDLSPFARSGLDATAFLEERYPQDAEAIRWLNQNVSGQPVILEAPGDSYSDDERVSAMTGLPTVLGWYVHEWLWRGDTAELNQRTEDIRTIYEGADENAVRSLLEQYDIQYVFIGERERIHYENLNEDMLLRMGTVVYGNPSSGGTYIIRTKLK